jgi:hypothetical protein
MLQIKINFSILNRAGAAMLAAPIIGHDAMLTLLVCTVLVHFSSYNNTEQL